MASRSEALSQFQQTVEVELHESQRLRAEVADLLPEKLLLEASRKFAAHVSRG